MKKQPLSLKRSAFLRLLIITFAVVLLFYGIGLYLNFMGVANVRDGLQTAITAEARYIAGELEREIQNLVTFQQELASDSQLLRFSFAYGIMSDYQRMEKVQNISNQLLKIKRFSSIVETARIFLPPLGRTIAADQLVFDHIQPSEWEAFSNEAAARPLRIQEVNGQLHLLYSNYTRKEPLFVIDIGILPSRLMERLNLMRSTPDTTVLLLRDDDTLYTGSTEAYDISRAITYNGWDYRYNGASYLVAQADIPSLGLKLHCFSPVNTVITPILRHNRWVWGLTLLAGFLLLVYLLYYRIYILHPLNTIFESVRRAEKTGRFLIDQSNADFDDIYAQFNALFEKLERLARQVYEEQFRAQRAELRQLQMQINPHFLYNTIFMVYRMAKAEGNEEIAQVCQNLSSYYRYITKTPGHDVQLKDEVAHIEQYLEIQKIRFSSRLTVEIDPLPAELENEELPPLILQPIVENAFVHGMKSVTSGGHVEIRYRSTAEHFSVIVRDNSGHMDEDAVAELTRQLRCGEMDEGSALQNLTRRMALRYGNEPLLESYQGGLQVTVTFPRKERKINAVTAGR